MNIKQSIAAFKAVDGFLKSQGVRIGPNSTLELVELMVVALATQPPQDEREQTHVDPDWENRNTESLSGWINELATLADHPNIRERWIRQAMGVIARGLSRFAEPEQPVALSTLTEDQAQFIADEFGASMDSPKTKAAHVAAILALATSAPAQQAGQGEYRQSLVDWVVGRWHEEVADRPMVNVHRRALDDTWRKILRHLSVDDRERLGPTHDELRGNSLMQDKARDLARAALSGTGSDESKENGNG